MNAYEDRIATNAVNRLHLNILNTVLEHMDNLQDMNIVFCEGAIDVDTASIVFEATEKTYMDKIKELVTTIFQKVQEFFNKLSELIVKLFTKKELKRLESELRDSKEKINLDQNPNTVMSFRQKAIFEFQTLLSRIKNGKPVSDDEIEEVEEKKISNVAKVAIFAIPASLAVAYVTKYIKVKEQTEKNVDSACDKAIADMIRRRKMDEVDDILESADALMRKETKIINLMARTFIEMGRDIKTLLTTIRVAVKLKALAKKSSEFDE